MAMMNGIARGDLPTKEKLRKPVKKQGGGLKQIPAKKPGMITASLYGTK